LRLLHAMSLNPAHRDAAAAAYLELLSGAQGTEKDGVLAGLGRTAGASAVPAIVAAIRDAEAPTLLVGMNALRAIPGSEVTRALVSAFPGLPPRAQAALLPVLGARRDVGALPVLAEIARSGTPDQRDLALEALGGTGLKQALDLLAAEAKAGDQSHRARAQAVMDRLAARVREEQARAERGAGGPETDLQGLLGIVGRWWVVGPFELGEKNEGWEIPHIGEPQISLIARYMAGKTRREWKRVVAQDAHGKIDLRAAIANRDNCIGYAYAEVVVEKPTDAVLLLGVDDSEKIWVNGAKVFEQFTARGLEVDQDKVPVRLKAGANSILLKIYQNTQGWEFCLRITTPDGRPLAFHQKAE
jgi:hypothetical protein